MLEGNSSMCGSHFYNSGTLSTVGVNYEADSSHSLCSILKHLKHFTFETENMVECWLEQESTSLNSSSSMPAGWP